MKSSSQSTHSYYDRESGLMMSEKFLKKGLFKWFSSAGQGRIIGHVLFNSIFFHRIIGWFANSSWSKFFIKRLIVAGDIDIKEAEFSVASYRSLNDFFCRRLKKGIRPIDNKLRSLVSPGEGKLLISTIQNSQQEVKIKGQSINISTLIGDQEYANRFKGGQIAILRLYLGDYHRFHFPVSGQLLSYKTIPGSFYPVSPLPSNKTNFYLKNHRIISPLLTNYHGLIMITVIGGFLISSITISAPPGPVTIGEEQGCFGFGGSTLVWLSEKNAIQYDEDILLKSQEGIETFVKLGTRIGIGNG